jgi:hypothetical protein
MSMEGGRGSALNKARFRPHHTFCERFLKVEASERGEEFERAWEKKRDILETQDDAVVEVIEGVDEICLVCPECRDDQCQSPPGGEQGVRKWDGILLKGLGINYGETRTSKEWRILIYEKAPLEFCKTRCPWRSRCTVFEVG